MEALTEGDEGKPLLFRDSEWPCCKGVDICYTRWFPTTPKRHAMIFGYLIQSSRPSSDDSINFLASLVAHHLF